THAKSGIDEPSTTHAGVHGFVGSMANEYGNWRVRLLDMPAREAWQIDAMFSTRFDQRGDAISYRRGSWLARELAAIDAL
ncbi:hypothetical protein AAHH80_38695, partial [Burkholderia pseudomallei]